MLKADVRFHCRPDGDDTLSRLRPRILGSASRTRRSLALNSLSLVSRAGRAVCRSGALAGCRILNMLVPDPFRGFLIMRSQSSPLFQFSAIALGLTGLTGLLLGFALTGCSAQSGESCVPG